MTWAQEKYQEEVTVIAVEVPVRVLYKGQVMRGLTKDDFELYENGIRQVITGFEVHSKRISLAKDISPEELKIAPKKRLFILIFNIFDYQKNVGEAIDYFFRNFFRPGDRLMVIIEDRLLNIEIAKSMPEVIQDFKDNLKKFKLISTFETYRTYKELRYEADRLLMDIGGKNWDQALLRFYGNYERAWRDFQKQFIIPDFNLYQSIIKRVKQIEGEKWAICFQQREMFPKLRNEGPLENKIRERVETPNDNPVVQVMQRIIKSKQMELMRLFDLTGRIPTEALKNLFLEANITFHLILLKSLRAIDSRDFEMREVAQDYEDCFRQISFSTGGHTSFSNKVVEALKEAAEVEDYYYLLVYNPKEDRSKERRNIEVKVNKKGADVISLKYVPQREVPPIAIVNFEAGEKAIRFDLVNYKMARLKEEIAGVADVRITLFNEASEKVFDEGKTLNLFKKEAHISLNFPQLGSGSYFIIIQAVDRVSNEIDVLSSAITL